MMTLYYVEGGEVKGEKFMPVEGGYQHIRGRYRGSVISSGAVDTHHWFTTAEGAARYAIRKLAESYDIFMAEREAAAMNVERIGKLILDLAKYLPQPANATEFAHAALARHKEAR